MTNNAELRLRFWSKSRHPEFLNSDARRLSSTLRPHLCDTCRSGVGGGVTCQSWRLRGALRAVLLQSKRVARVVAILVPSTLPSARLSLPRRVQR